MCISDVSLLNLHHHHSMQLYKDCMFSNKPTCPMKMALNCSMPAMVSKTVGSSGIKELLGSLTC